MIWWHSGGVVCWYGIYFCTFGGIYGVWNDFRRILVSVLFWYYFVNLMANVEWLLGCIGISGEFSRNPSPTSQCWSAYAIDCFLHCNRIHLLLSNSGRCCVPALHILAPLSGKIKTDLGLNKFGLSVEGNVSREGILLISWLLTADIETACQFWCEICAMRMLISADFGCL